MYKYIEPNLNGNDYVVGDIHGMFTLLYQTLKDLNFNPEQDRLFSVGDLVDRGKESSKVLYLLNKPWFFPVRGNHEDLTILAYSKDPLYVDNHCRNGGYWFQEISEESQKSIVDKFSDLPIMMETIVNGKTIGFVHGDITDWDTTRYEIKDLTLEESMLNTTCNRLQWGRSRIQRGIKIPCKGIDHVFLGHTPLQDIKTYANCTFIDTAACFHNKLTILNIKDFLQEISLAN